jgi:hypothetical protein
MVIPRWLEILPDGEYVAARGAEIGERGVQFLFGFSQSDHDARFGQDRRVEALDHAEHVQRTVVVTLRANRPGQALDHLEIVVIQIGTGGHQGRDARLAGVKIRRENLDGRLGRGGPNRPHAFREMARAFIRQIVAGHGGDNHVGQAQIGDRFGQPLGFVGFGRIGPGGIDGAIVAAPRAPVSEDHERGVPLRPALAEVGTARFLAHRGHSAPRDDPPRLGKVGHPRQGPLEPRRQTSLARVARKVDNG